MKKAQFIQVILIVLGISVSTMTFAQSHHGHSGGNGPVTPVQLGDVILNLGVGVGADYKGDDYNTGFGTKIAIEKALWQAGPGVITLGGEIRGSWSSGGDQSYDNHNSSPIIKAATAPPRFCWSRARVGTFFGGFFPFCYFPPSPT